MSQTQPQQLSLANLQEAMSQNNTKLKEWVNAQIGNIEMFSISWVSELPTENISTSTIYMVKSNESEEGNNVYVEYVYNTEKAVWEILGELQTEVDLSGYYTKEETYNKNEVYAKGETYSKEQVYTKEETYKKDEVYSKEETYKKDEVYAKEETYGKDEVYTKEEVYAKDETYKKDEVDTMLATHYTTEEVTNMVNGIWSE